MRGVAPPLRMLGSIPRVGVPAKLAAMGERRGPPATETVDRLVPASAGKVGKRGSTSTGLGISTVPLRLWRIVTGPHPVWSGEGARLFGQRWNPPGLAAIYTGTSFAACLVEILVHANRKSPPSAARFVEAVVPDDVSCEELDCLSLPGWDDPRDTSVAQSFGRAWIESRRSALLFVPSVVTAAHDVNVVVNPDHPDAARISVGPETAVALDRGSLDPDAPLITSSVRKFVNSAKGCRTPDWPPYCRRHCRWRRACGPSRRVFRGSG